MTQGELRTLEQLCRKFLREFPEVDGHEIGEAIKLTGAFASATLDTQARMDEEKM